MDPAATFVNMQEFLAVRAPPTNVQYVSSQIRVPMCSCAAFASITCPSRLSSTLNLPSKLYAYRSIPCLYQTLRFRIVQQCNSIHPNHWSRRHPIICESTRKRNSIQARNLLLGSDPMQPTSNYFWPVAIPCLKDDGRRRRVVSASVSATWPSQLMAVD